MNNIYKYNKWHQWTWYGISWIEKIIYCKWYKEYKKFKETK